MQKSINSEDLCFSDVAKFPYSVLSRRDEMPEGCDPNLKEVNIY